MTNHPIIYYYYLVSKTLQAGKDSIHKTSSKSNVQSVLTYEDKLCVHMVEFF